MKEYPAFMRRPANIIASHQKSAGVEGYLFDGIDGSQIAVFQCSNDGISKEHVHDFDEYFIVARGEYVLGIGGRRIRLTTGEEYHIPGGVPHDGAFVAGTRTINAFGGKRADRGTDVRSSDLAEIRREIDGVDSGIVSLLAKRARLVSAAGKLKKNEDGVRDPGRVEQVIEGVRAKALSCGVDPAIAEEIYRVIIGCFLRKETDEFRERSQSPS